MQLFLVFSEQLGGCNMEGALSLRHSHCGDVGPTGSISQPTIWHQGAKECETVDEPQIAKLSA